MNILIIILVVVGTLLILDTIISIISIVVAMKNRVAINKNKNKIFFNKMNINKLIKDGKREENKS